MNRNLTAAMLLLNGPIPSGDPLLAIVGIVIALLLFIFWHPIPTIVLIIGFVVDLSLGTIPLFTIIAIFIGLYLRSRDW